MENHMCFLLVMFWCIIEILSCEVTKRHFCKFHDVRSGSGKALLYVRIVLTEGTKTRLVLHREIQESLIFDCYTSLLSSL